MRPTVIFLAIFLLAVSPACLMVPTSMGDPEPFTEDSLAFLKIGATTKAQVKREMSAFAIATPDGAFRVNLQPMAFHNGSVWLYSMVRGEMSWLRVALPDPTMASPGSVGDAGSQDYRYLLIRFDDGNVVAGYQRSESEGKGCNVDGVCASGPAYMLLASKDADQAAKGFQPPPGQCGVYLYGSKVRQGAPIWFNDQRAGWLLDTSTYLYWAADPGAYQLSSKTPDGRFKPSVQFDCEAGGLNFVELRQKGFRVDKPISTELLEPVDSSGRRAIKSRKRLMVPSYPS